MGTELNKGTGIDAQLGLAWELTKVIFKARDQYPAGFTSDEIFMLSAEAQLPPMYVRTKVGAFLKSMRHAGHIVKTKEYRTSRRPGNSALPIYVKPSVS